jgi:hypothetical protein
VLADDIFNSLGRPGEAFYRDPEGDLVELGDLQAALESGEVVTEPVVVERGRPMAWLTDDLVTWERVVADFDEPGMITEVESVAATELGWFIFGVRRTDTADPLERRVAEWAAWVSPDGRVWEEYPIGDLFDAPQECRPSQQPPNCIRMKGRPAPDGGLAVYAYEWDLQASDFRDLTWRLLIGLPIS